MADKGKLKNKLIKALIMVALVFSVILLILILFQPTNVVVDEEFKAGYSSLFGWIGFLLALPLAWFIVHDNLETDAAAVEKGFHYIGVWGTRGCVVAIMYMIFAIGGYVIPVHTVNMTAFETYKEKVLLEEYRVSAGSTISRDKRSWYSFPDEFLVVRYSNGRKVPLIFNNTFGSNKLDASAISALYSGNNLLLAGQQSAIKVGTYVTINGRRHTLGHTIDSITRH